jgi:glucosamine kinase
MLIADSGSTKTDWRFIHPITGKINSISTTGLNPVFSTSNEIAIEIKKKFPVSAVHTIRSSKSKIYFYGAGCSSKERNRVLTDALKKIFPTSKAIIHHDITASARALLGTNQGIACILGTGSNSCYYDGEKVVKTIGGLGYVLGDEGSGAHIGKEFIKSYLNDELPEHLHRQFEKKHHLNKNKIIHSIYTQKYPNRFLSSFARFIHSCLEDSFIKELVTKCVDNFFEKTICKYENHKNLPVGFVGSIAENFKPIIYTVATNRNIKITKIISNPIDELVSYHST